MRPNRSGITSFLPLCAALLLLMGCGGGGSDDPAQSDKGCPELSLAASEGMPLDAIAIQGIPDSFSTLLAARVSTPGGATSLTLVARQGAPEEVILYAPLHPAGLAEGGTVALEIFDEAGRTCKSQPFEILPLPAAPGATRAMLDSTERIIDLQAGYFASSVEQLRLADVTEIPAQLLPLYLAQHSLNDPENPNSFLALLEGTAPALDGAAPDIDLLDRLLAHLGLPEALAESVVELEGLLEDQAPQQRRLQPSRTVLQVRDGPRNAFQLHSEMEMAQWSRAFQGDRGLAQATRGVATGVGLVGLVPVPKVKAGSMVLGSGLFSFLKATEAAANLLPSRFVSIDFELSPETMGEDDPSSGRWHDVMVVARSEGWQLDRAMLESLLQLANVKGGYSSWINRFAPEGFAKTVQEHLMTESVNLIIGRATNDSGIFTIPPKLTEPIEITEDPWSFAVISYALEEDGRQGYRLKPSWESGYEGEVQIGTALGHFGGQHIYARRKVEILPVQIVIEPPHVTVDPGETVEFRVTVRNANDKTVSVHADNGMTVHQPQPDRSHRITYTAPATEDELPDNLIVTSESTSGFLANPGREPPRGIAIIRGKRRAVEISPRSACVKSGSQQTFTAAVFNLENEAVQWEVDNGRITNAGVYTAPSENGFATITATSVEDPTVTDSVTIGVGSCACNWSVTISGNSAAVFGGSNLSLTLEDGKVTNLIFAAPPDARVYPAGMGVELLEGQPSNQPGTFQASMGGSLFNQGEHADEFGSIAPVSIHLRKFESQDKNLIVEGSIQGTVFWERINDLGPEKETDWPGSIHLSFEATMESMGGLAPPWSNAIFFCNPF